MIHSSRFVAVPWKFAVVLLMLVLVLMSVHSSVAWAETPTPTNWVEFQNGGQSSVAGGRLAREWSPEDRFAWTAGIPGYGQSTPIVARGMIVVTSTSGDNKDDFHLVAYSATTGELQWQLDLRNPSPFPNTPMVSRAAPTPLATANGFIAFFEGGMLVSVSDDGTERWRRNLVDLCGPIEARHGLSASLEQDDERLFVWVERSEHPYVLAIAKESGEVMWKVDGVGKTSWASPRLIDVDGGKHLVCSASGLIVGIDPLTGERLWTFDDIGNNSSCTPMPAGLGRFLIGASDGRGETSAGDAATSNGLVEINRLADDTWSAAFKWRAEKATCTFGSPVVAGDRALFVNRTGVLFQLDLESGEQRSVERTDAGGIWATPLVVGNLVYLFGHQGTTSVVDLSTGKTLFNNRCWESANDNPAAVGGSVLYAAAVAGDFLVLRRGDKLFAIPPSE